MSYLDPEQQGARAEGSRGRPKLHSSGSLTANVGVPAQTTQGQTQASKKRPTGSKQSHGRSLSNIMTSSNARPHLARSKSTDGIALKQQSGVNSSGGPRPGGLKRNPRSFSKLTGLQPLTKSALNQLIKLNKSNLSLKGLNVSALSGLKTSAKKGKAILRLNDDDDDDYEDTGSPPDSLEAEQLQLQLQQQSLHADLNQQQLPAHASAMQGLAPLPPQVQHLQNQEEAQNHSQYSFQSTDDLTNVYGGLLFLSQSTGLTKKIDRGMAGVIDERVATNNVNGGAGDTSAKNSNIQQHYLNSESVSGISFKAKPIEKLEPITTPQTIQTTNSYLPNQTIFNNLQRKQNAKAAAGDHANVGSSLSSLNSAGHRTNATNGDENANFVIPTGGTNDFQNFLKNNSINGKEASGHENRTQQRLWLQRENSLMDVPTIDAAQLANFSSLSLNNLMFSHQGATQHENPQQQQQLLLLMQRQGAHQILPLLLVQLATPGANATTPGGGSESSSSLYGLLLTIQSAHQNSIQSRTEFERLNREYLNVRRNLNPVGASLTRTQEYFKTTSLNQKVTKPRGKANGSGSGNGDSASANTFKEFSPVYQEKENEINHLIGKMWQGALLSSSSSSATSPLRVAAAHSTPASPVSGQLGAHSQQATPLAQLSTARPTTQRLQSYTQSNYLRSPQTPTTRAVKLAASGNSQQQFKKNNHLVNLA